SAITTRAKIFLTFLTSVSLTALDARCAMAAPKGGNHLNLGSVSLAAEGPAACELGAGAHSEFGVHTRERSFHRSRCDVECRGHFAVRPPFGDELGDTSLRCRQLPARRRAAADPPKLGAGALGPQRRAQLLEEAKRSLKRIPRGAALTRLPLHESEGEERARPLERQRQPLELVERAIAFGLRLVGRARSRSDQPTAAMRSSEGRPTADALCMLLEARELRRRRIKFPESDERLDVGGDEANRTWLANSGSLDALDERAEALVCVGGSGESELEQAERPGAPGP